LRFTDECSRLSVRDLLESASPSQVAAQSRRRTQNTPLRYAS
jgi:hypothetical protein